MFRSKVALNFIVAGVLWILLLLLSIIMVSSAKNFTICLLCVRSQSAAAPFYNKVVVNRRHTLVCSCNRNSICLVVGDVMARNVQHGRRDMMMCCSMRSFQSSSEPKCMRATLSFLANSSVPNFFAILFKVAWQRGHDM